MKIPKRIIALVMAVLIGVSGCIYSFAFGAKVDCDIPIIVVSGDSDPIYDSEGNIAFSTRDLDVMLENFTQGESLTDALTSLVKEASAEYVKGFLKQDFTDYYQLFADKLDPVFAQSRLDNNGEISNGSHIRWRKGWNTRNYTQYDTDDYRFWYDWRLDPFVAAEELNEYIQEIKASTGYDQVGVICRCLGTDVFLAYVSEYGMDDIYGVGFDGTVVNGAELLSEPISGGFALDTGSINRFLIDLNTTGKASVNPKITAALDTVSKSGIVDLVKFFVNLYAYPVIEKGLISTLALSTVFTWPGYWATVKSSDYETAKEYVFGPEGSELREEYAGLIEKLDNYDVRVRQHIPELMQEINDNANLIVIAKYGLQTAPEAKSRDYVGDTFATVTSASFGATTGTIFEPLSDEYLAERAEAGYSKYLSPDNEIDASTCLFPDQTFFIKGAAHSDWTTPEMELLSKVICADHQLTVDDLPEYQFMVYDYDTDSIEAMTSENYHTEGWTADKSERSYNPISKFISLVKSVSTLIKILSD